MLPLTRRAHGQPKYLTTTTRRSHAHILSLEVLDDRTVPSSTSITAPVSIDPTTIGTATSGKVASFDNGTWMSGTWVKSVTQDGTGRETVTVTTSYTSGVQVTDTDLITKNASTGVTTDDHTTTTTTKTGSRTTTNDDTYTPEANGVVGIVEVVTNAQGQTATYTGWETTSTTSYGSKTDETLTNPAGQRETFTIERFTTGDATATEEFGTNFQGHAFTSATLKTYNGVAKTNTVDSSVDGHGKYTFSETKPITGLVVVNVDKTFKDGTVVKSTKTIATDGAGNTDVNQISYQKSADGKMSSSTTDLNYTSTGKGSETISGTFSQSNGHWGSAVGTVTKTKVSSTTDMTETDQNGVQKPIKSVVLTIGGARFAVNMDTTFDKKSENTATLTTGDLVTTPE